MDKSNWQPKKPYDIRQRLFEFACVTVRVVQYLHTRGPVGAALSYQLLKCGTSAGANFEEADLLTADHDAVMQEADELVRILATLIRNSTSRRT